MAPVNAIATGQARRVLIRVCAPFVVSTLIALLLHFRIDWCSNSWNQPPRPSHTALIIAPATDRAIAFLRPGGSAALGCAPGSHVLCVGNLPEPLGHGIDVQRQVGQRRI